MVAKIQNLRASQPDRFAFTSKNMEEAERMVSRYPAGKQQSAVMPLLDLAQRQHGGWLPKAAMDTVAEMLGMPPVRVYEVASFYTMYNLEPVGENLIQICTTTPCWLRGSDDIVKACEKRLGVKLGGSTPDGRFSLREVECLGACVNAPMCQIGDHFFEDLTPESMVTLVDALDHGMQPKPGPQGGRKSSEPAGKEEA
jgi:NADH-quinone oxidoreductase subunit E